MAENHTVKAFDEDISKLRGLIAEMGGLAEVAIADAVDALSHCQYCHQRSLQVCGEAWIRHGGDIDWLEATFALNF